MSIDLTQQLMSHWQTGRLAPFYLIECHGFQEHVHEWSKKFLCQVLMQEKKLTEEAAGRLLEAGHADILIIKNPKSDRPYRMGDEVFEAFFRFLEFSPLQLKHRFLVVEEAHQLREDLMNKLLKSLEEPGKNISILFLSALSNKFLPTIKSRAICLRLPPPTPYYGAHFNRSNWQEELLNGSYDAAYSTVIDFTQGKLSLTECLERHPSQGQGHEALIRALMEIYLLRGSDYQELQTLCTVLEDWQEMALWHLGHQALLAKALMPLSGPQHRLRVDKSS